MPSGYRVDDEEYREANECRRKVKYRRQQAIKASVSLHLEFGNFYDAYECVFCGGWHVGKSVTNNERKAMETATRVQ